MTNLAALTTGQIKRIVAIKEQIEVLESQINSIADGHDFSIPFVAVELPKRKARRSAAVRARMAAAQQARWAKIKGTGATAAKPAKKGKRRLRAAIIAGTEARWARMKGNEATLQTTKKKDRRSSPAVRAKLAAAAKARWAKVRAEGKKTL
jgi:hypothetical protein